MGPTTTTRPSTILTVCPSRNLLTLPKSFTSRDQSSPSASATASKKRTIRLHMQPRRLCNTRPILHLVSTPLPPSPQIDIRFIARVEPSSGKPTSGKYKFKLSIRTGGVERSLGEPVEMSLTMDPRQLSFVVLWDMFHHPIWVFYKMIFIASSQERQTSLSAASGACACGSESIWSTIGYSEKTSYGSAKTSTLHPL